MARTVAAEGAGRTVDGGLPAPCAAALAPRQDAWGPHGRRTRAERRLPLVTYWSTHLSQGAPQVHTNTFAGRMGRWSAQHRKKAIWGWIAFVVIAFAVGNAAGTKAAHARRLRRAVRPGREAVRRPLRREGRRAGHGPGAQGRQGDRRRRPRGRCSNHRRRVGQARRDERPVALSEGQRGPGLQGRALRARAVRPQGRHGQDRRARQADDHRRRQGQGRQPQASSSGSSAAPA